MTVPHALLIIWYQQAHAKVHAQMEQLPIPLMFAKLAIQDVQREPILGNMIVLRARWIT